MQNIHHPLFPPHKHKPPQPPININKKPSLLSCHLRSFTVISYSGLQTPNCRASSPLIYSPQQSSYLLSLIVLVFSNHSPNPHISPLLVDTFSSCSTTKLPHSFPPHPRSTNPQQRL